MCWIQSHTDQRLILDIAGRSLTRMDLTESSYARILLNHAILQLAILIRTKNSTSRNRYLQLPFSSTLSPDPVAPYRLYFSYLHVPPRYMYTSVSSLPTSNHLTLGQFVVDPQCLYVFTLVNQMTAIFHYSMIVIAPHIGAVLDRLQLTARAVRSAV